MSTKIQNITGETATFSDFAEGLKAYCHNEGIRFLPGTADGNNFQPLLDLYKAFDTFRAKHNLMETVGTITMLNAVDDVSNIVWSSGKTQELWREIIQDLSMLVISLFHIDETIHDNNHP